MLLSYLKFIVAKRILFSIQELLVLSKDNFSILILGKGIKKKKTKKTKHSHLAEKNIKVEPFSNVPV